MKHTFMFKLQLTTSKMLLPARVELQELISSAGDKPGMFYITAFIGRNKRVNGRMQYERFTGMGL
jgi:hypothetical protein